METSFKHGGYLDTTNVTKPAVVLQKTESYLEKGSNCRSLRLGVLLENWDKKRSSLDQNRRMSGMLNRTMAKRSSPSPNAQPLRPSSLLDSKIFDWMTPLPRTSSHRPW